MRLGEAATSTVTCISLDRWHQNGKGGAKTGSSGNARDQLEAWLRLVRGGYDWVDGGRRRA